MKVKDLQDKLAGINPEADILVTTNDDTNIIFDLLEVMVDFNRSEVNNIQLLCSKTEVEYVRKALLVQYDNYHPAFNKDWDEKLRESYAASMTDFLKSYLPCGTEEAVKIANEVIDEVSSLSVEEVKTRIERKECIGAVINRIVGREVIPAVLPDMK